MAGDDLGGDGHGTIVGPAADVTPAPETIEPLVPAEILAQSLGEYVRVQARRVRGGESGVLPVVLALVIITVVFQVISPHHVFLSARNIVNLFQQSAVFMVLAMAEIFALLLGEIDLSVGLVMSLSAVVAAELVQPNGPGWPWWAAIIAALLICSGVGAVQGSLVARLKVPSLVVTLGGLLVLEGVSIIVLGGTLVSISNVRFTNEAVLYNLFWGSLSPLASWILLGAVVVGAGGWLWLRDEGRRRGGLVARPASLTAIMIAMLAAGGAVLTAICNVNRAHQGTIEGVPYIIPIVLAVLGGWTLLLQRTQFGRYANAIGGNPEAARRAGISLTAVRTWGFILASLTSGIAGVLYASWQVSLTTNIIKSANTYVLLAVAAAVIGGTSLFGGRAKTIHGVLGGLVIGGIFNGLYLLGISSEWVDIAVAGVLLIAVAIDVFSRRGAWR